MAAEHVSAKQVAHPAPQRHRVGLGALWFGILAAPLAWLAQELFSYSVASKVCPPDFLPYAAGAAGSPHAGFLLVELVAFIIAIAGGAVSVRSWRKTSGEQPGSAHHLMDAGKGRTRFLAMCGLIDSVIFLIALVVTLGTLLTVPHCA